MWLVEGFKLDHIERDSFFGKPGYPQNEVVCEVYYASIINVDQKVKWGFRVIVYPDMPLHLFTTAHNEQMEEMPGFETGEGAKLRQLVAYVEADGCPEAIAEAHGILAWIEERERVVA